MERGRAGREERGRVGGGERGRTGRGSNGTTHMNTCMNVCKINNDKVEQTPPDTEKEIFACTYYYSHIYLLTS